MSEENWKAHLNITVNHNIYFSVFWFLAPNYSIQNNYEAVVGLNYNFLCVFNNFALIIHHCLAFIFGWDWTTKTTFLHSHAWIRSRQATKFIRFLWIILLIVIKFRKNQRQLGNSWVILLKIRTKNHWHRCLNHNLQNFQRNNFNFIWFLFKNLINFTINWESFFNGTFIVLWNTCELKPLAS